MCDRRQPPDSDQLELVLATERDRAYLLDLRIQTMTEHLEAAGVFLTPAQHGERLDDDYACCYCLVHRGQTVGMVKFRELASSVEIMQLQIHPGQQSKGYGRSAILKLRELYRAKPLQLSVLKGNPAVSLYRRLGFEVVGEDEYEYFMSQA